MSNVKSITKSEPSEPSVKDIGTDILLQSQTVRMRDRPLTKGTEDLQGGVGTTGVDFSTKIRMGLPGNKGLKIVPIPGGLYRVSNLAGGEPPAPMGGMHTDLGKIQKLVLEYNSKVK